jgi:hypothetical protein
MRAGVSESVLALAAKQNVNAAAQASRQGRSFKNTGVMEWDDVARILRADDGLRTLSRARHIDRQY